MSSLILHRGASEVSFDQLAAVPTPEATNTWFPVGHATVLQQVRTTLLNSGFTINREQLSLGQGNARFFGTLDLTSGLANGVTLSVGVRNSIDKSFPIGFCAGARVFVCDNLSFDSELVVSRKHTRFGGDRYREAISLAVQRLADFQVAEYERIKLLKATDVRSEKADSIILRSYSSGLISHHQLPEVIKEWNQPRFEEFQPRTLWSLWNAFTWATKKVHTVNPQRFAGLTMGLRGLFNGDEVPASQAVLDAVAREPELALSV